MVGKIDLSSEKLLNSLDLSKHFDEKVHVLGVRKRRVYHLVLLALIVLFSSVSNSWDLASGPTTQAHAKITATFSHSEYARQDLVVVTGKATDDVGGFPIPLAKVVLKYFHDSEQGIAREVKLTTLSPGGNFEDRFNATTLANLGKWFLNVTFPAQLGYISANLLADFYVKTKTGLTINASSRSVGVGDSVSISGYLFPCAPCIDQTVKLFIRHSDWIQVFDLPLTPRGSPYPVGVYNFTFRPDSSGEWRVSAFFPGNEFSFNSTSNDVDVSVGVLGLSLGVGPVLAISSGVVLAGLVVVYSLRRKLRGAPSNENSGNP